MQPLVLNHRSLTTFGSNAIIRMCGTQVSSILRMLEMHVNVNTTIQNEQRKTNNAHGGHIKTNKTHKHNEAKAPKRIV